MSAQAGEPGGHASRWVVMRPANTPEGPRQVRARAGNGVGADSRPPVCYPGHMASSEPSLPVVPHDDRAPQDESVLTVVVAFVANILIAVAKSVAAAVTGSASMLAEAAHSWADTGNEMFLLIAQRRPPSRPTVAHPLGHGREVYVWSLFAAIGLFAVGAGGVDHPRHPRARPPGAGQRLRHRVRRPGGQRLLEGASFFQASRQAKRARPRDATATCSSTCWRPATRPSAPCSSRTPPRWSASRSPSPGSGCTRSRGRRRRTRSARSWSACCSGVVAIVLIDRNRRFLVGESADPERAGRRAARAAQAMPGVARVTELRLEFVGARHALPDGSGRPRGQPASRMRRRTSSRRSSDGSPANPRLVGALLSLSEPEEASWCRGPWREGVGQAHRHVEAVGAGRDSRSGTGAQPAYAARCTQRSAGCCRRRLAGPDVAGGAGGTGGSRGVR